MEDNECPLASLLDLNKAYPRVFKTRLLDTI